jgi:hypothetical protein
MFSGGIHAFPIFCYADLAGVGREIAGRREDPEGIVKTESNVNGGETQFIPDSPMLIDSRAVSGVPDMNRHPGNDGACILGLAISTRSPSRVVTHGGCNSHGIVDRPLDGYEDVDERSRRRTHG